MRMLKRVVTYYEIQTLRIVIYIKSETIHMLVKEKEGMIKEINKVNNVNKELDKENMRLEE